MNDIYRITDSRDYKMFSKKSFSGYKKTDVMNALFKSIESKKIENACHWTTECIISGYTLSLWEKLIIYGMKVVHINNPSLPSYLLMKHRIFYNQYKQINAKKENILLLRNSQMIRNLFFDVVTTLSTSLKTKRYDKLIKINEKEDFNFITIQKRLCSKMNILPDHIILFHDPDELRIIINEIFTMLKNKQFGYDSACYWVLWLYRWEKIHKKNKQIWSLSLRKVKDIDPKYGCDLSWVLWSVILEEMNQRKDPIITQQINSIYQLYKSNYTSGKQTSRLPYIYYAIGFLTHDINFKIPIRSEYKIYFQVQANVNKMFLSKKMFEETQINDSIPNKQTKTQKPITTNKQDENINIEIVTDKISIFNELDTQFCK